jgi:hypothetical protein
MTGSTPHRDGHHKWAISAGNNVEHEIEARVATGVYALQSLVVLKSITVLLRASSVASF